MVVDVTGSGQFPMVRFSALLLDASPMKLLVDLIKVYDFCLKR
jgi:hypothetical protein